MRRIKPERSSSYCTFPVSPSRTLFLLTAELLTLHLFKSVEASRRRRKCPINSSPFATYSFHCTLTSPSACTPSRHFG